MFKNSLIALIFLCSLVLAQSPAEQVDTAVQLYETRHMNPANLDEARTILEGVLEQNPQHLRALYELSHVYYLLGDNVSSKEEKLDLYEKGRDIGEQAIDIDDGCAEAHFWYMVNMGRIGQTKGVLNSLAMVPTIRDEINRVLNIDPEHTGALDAKAMLYFELPGILGGSLNKSKKYLNNAIALDSNYTLLYVDMAKVLIKQKEYGEARSFLKQALEIIDPTYPADHILDDKPEAELLLEDIKEK